MPSPTNPKKRSLMPSSPLRRALRAAGHHRDPVVQVGKEGVKDALVRELEAQLLAHELVKVKVGTESPEDRFEAAERIAAEAGAQIAQVLGRTVLVYKRHPERPRFEPAAAPAPAAAPPRTPGRPPARERGARGRAPAGREARGAQGAGRAKGGRAGGRAKGGQGGGRAKGGRGGGGPRGKPGRRTR